MPPSESGENGEGSGAADAADDIELELFSLSDRRRGIMKALKSRGDARDTHRRAGTSSRVSARQGSATLASSSACDPTGAPPALAMAEAGSPACRAATRRKGSGDAFVRLVEEAVDDDGPPVT